MAYSPSSNLTGTATLGHLQQLFYRKRGLDRLQKKFLFREVCMDDMLPKQVGRTIQFFRYINPAAVTTVTTEGTVGTGLSLTSKVVSATVSQYSSFMTVSDLLKDTAIDPILQAASDLLGYQAGLSVDVIVRTIIDAESSSTNQTVLGSNGYLRLADLRNSRHTLQANDVRPFEDNKFKVILHPYVSFDVVNDPSAVGYADIVKYTAPANTALTRYEDRGMLTNEMAGCVVHESTNVKTLTSPNKYRVYVFGQNGVGCVDLEGRGPNKVIDPTKQRFNINVIPGAPSIVDPEGVIGGAVSYNFIFSALVLEGPTGIGGTYRYKTIDAQSSIG
jgi:N4-gp56 family major capsid protein